MPKTTAILTDYERELRDIAEERRRIESMKSRREYTAAEAGPRLATLEERERQARRDALAALRDERRDATRAREAAEQADPLLTLDDEQLRRAQMVLTFIDRDVAAGLLDPATIGDRMQAALAAEDFGLLFALVSVARQQARADFRWGAPVKAFVIHFADKQAQGAADERIAAADKATAKLDEGAWSRTDSINKYLKQAGVLT